MLVQLREVPHAHRWWAFGIFLLATIAVLSLIRLGPAPVQLPGGFDKYEHFAAYAVLAGYFGLLVRGCKTIALSACLLVAFGILIEFAQAYGGVRSGDWRDVLANSAGVAFGSFLALRGGDQWWRRMRALTSVNQV